MFRRPRHRVDGGVPPRRQGLFALAPLLISLAAFIFALLSLLAGYKPGFMPETHIVLLDASGLGRNLLPARRAALPAGVIDEAKDKLKNKTDGVIDNIVDGVTDAIGVDRFYALHAMTVCSGQYAGGGNDPARGFDVRRCTQPLRELNVIDVIDLDLRARGPIRAALADLARDAPRIFQAVAGLFIAGTLFTGLAMLGAFVAVLIPSRGRLLGKLGVVSLSLAALALLCGTLLTTIGGDKLAEVVENRAGRVGLRAVVGAKFRGLSWTAFALAVLAALVWIFGLAFVYGKRRRRSRGDKDAAWSSSRGGGKSMGSSRSAFALTVLAGLTWIFASFFVYSRSGRREGRGPWDANDAGSPTREAGDTTGERRESRRPVALAV